MLGFFAALRMTDRKQFFRTLLDNESRKFQYYALAIPGSCTSVATGSVSS